MPASTLSHDIAFERLADLAKLRWRLERDYQELRQELGGGVVGDDAAGIGLRVQEWTDVRLTDMHLTLAIGPTLASTPPTP